MVTTLIDSSEDLLSSAKRARASLAMATEQDERLIKLLTNGTEGQWVSSADIDWDRQSMSRSGYLQAATLRRSASSTTAIRQFSFDGTCTSI